MKTLVVFYSYSGNTKSIARIIAQEIGCDLAEIETVRPYKGDYNAVVKQGQQEVNRGFMPEIMPLGVDIASYDRIILGSPVWWYTFAPAMHTFLHQNNLSQKIVYPFATNGGWIGHTLHDFQKACRSASVQEGLDIRFDESKLRTPESAIKHWIGKML